MPTLRRVALSAVTVTALLTQALLPPALAASPAKNADLAVSVRVQNPALAKATMQYPVVVAITNKGPAALQSGTVRITLPKDAKSAKLPSGCSAKKNASQELVDCGIGALKAGKEFTRSFTVSVNAKTKTPQKVQASIVKTSNPDPIAKNNSATAELKQPVAAKLSAGNLYVTQSSLPPQQLLLAGEKGGEILRLRFAAQQEDINVRSIALEQIGESLRSINHVELWKNGVLFAAASAGSCGPEYGPNFLCAHVSPDNPFIVPKDGIVDVSVLPHIKANSQGAVSRDAVILRLRGVANADSVSATGMLSSSILVRNDGDALAEGEVFIGTNQPAPDQPVDGSRNIVVMSKISSIANGADPALEGTPVPRGTARLGSFRFTAPSNSNFQSGPSVAAITYLLFTIDAPNVFFNDDAFRYYNVADPSVSESCRVVKTEQWKRYVECVDMTGSFVDVELEPDSQLTLALDGVVADPSVNSSEPSSLQVRLEQINDPGLITWGKDASHIRWWDRYEGAIQSGGLSWVQMSESIVQSTGYVGAPAPVCGNDVPEQGEQCDDGNTEDGDRCSSTCQLETTNFSCALPGNSQLDVTTDGTYLYLVSWKHFPDRAEQVVYKMDTSCNVLSEHALTGRGSGAFGIAHDSGSFWVTHDGMPVSYLVELNSSFVPTGREIEVPSNTVQGAGINDGKLWTAHNTFLDDIFVTDLATGVSRFAFHTPGGAPYGLTVNDDALWVGSSGTIYALDKQNGATLATIANPTVHGYITGLTILDGNLWVVDNTDDRMYRIPLPSFSQSPADLSVSAVSRTPAEPVCGGTIVFSQTVSNAGPGSPEHVSLVTAIPSSQDGISVVFDPTASSAGCSADLAKGEVTCANVPLGTPTAIAFTIPAGMRNNSVLGYHAIVKSELADPTMQNNIADINWIDVRCQSAICGNGTIESGEQCDDGNTANGDGCSAQCTIEPATCDPSTLPPAVKAYVDGGLVTPFQACALMGTTALRQDFIRLLVDINGGVLNPAPSTPTFDDVPSSSRYFRWFEDAAKESWITGDDNCIGTHPCLAHPQDPLTKSEFAVMSSRAFGLPLLGIAPQAADNPAGTPYHDAIQKVLEKCALALDTQNRVFPQGTLLWEEMLSAFYHIDQNDQWGQECGSTSTPSHFLSARAFYNNSAWDGNNAAANDLDYDAVAPLTPVIGHGHATNNEPEKELGKTTLLQNNAASFANYTSYAKGLNGIVLVFDHLAVPTGITAADFDFKVGNSDTPTSWAAAPAPVTIRVQEDVTHEAFGLTGTKATVVTLIWADDDPYTKTKEPGAISNQWLQLTVKATPSTGLTAPAVVYYGNQIGESGNPSAVPYAIVDSADEIGARQHPHSAFNAATLADPYDFNRDKKVDQNDEILARNNAASAFSALKLITLGTVQLPASLSVSQLSLPATNATVRNAKDISLLRSEVRAGDGNDVLLMKAVFSVAEGSGANATNYALWVDTDGNRVVDTILQKNVSASASETVTFDNLSGGGYILRGTGNDRNVIFEVHADVAVNPPTNTLMLSFGTAQTAYIEAKQLSNSALLQGIRTNGVCASSACAITVTTSPETQSTLWTIHSQGNLFITQDTLPVPSRQLLGGTLGESVLHLRLRAEKEPVDVTRLTFAALNGNERSIDRLELFLPGADSPFAYATHAGCAPSTASNLFCAVMQSQQLVISDTSENTVVVRPRIKTDADGAQSADAFQLFLVHTVSDDPYVEHLTARGLLSSQSLAQNNNDNVAEGELIVGRSAPGPNVDIQGSANVVVMSKMTSITNANEDQDGSALIPGPKQFGIFKFSTAENTNTANGTNAIALDTIIFDVTATNVAISPLILIKDLSNPDSIYVPCTVYNQDGGQTAIGSFHLICRSVTRIASGSDATLAISTLVMQPKIDAALPSQLVVSLRNFNDSTQTTAWIDRSHLRWKDTDAATNQSFLWTESTDTTVRSTNYQY